MCLKSTNIGEWEEAIERRFKGGGIPNITHAVLPCYIPIPNIPHAVIHNISITRLISMTL